MTPTKNLVWGEYSHRILSIASECLIKQQQQEFVNNERRFQNKLELTEQELLNRKQEFETERAGSRNKLQDLERDRAVLKAQETNLLQKIEYFQAEKAKLEKKYDDLSQATKNNESKLERDYKERVNLLESRVDFSKTENIQNIASLEKKIALLEQELVFTNKEKDNYFSKIDSYEIENKNFRSETSKYQELNEVIIPLNNC